MGHNVIGDGGMSSIADGLHYNKALTKLNIACCGLSIKGNYCTFSVAIRQSSK